MIILKCKMCGGDILPIDNSDFGTCDSCGNTMTLPKVDEEKKAQAFNRANHLRLNHNFDDALIQYNILIQEDNQDAEVYWCSLLCRYGIEYVKDPATNMLIPTCHRIMMQNINNDIDYLSALKYSKSKEIQNYYTNEVKKFADIQKRIITIAQSEKPYDIFICYKELDENKNRTNDSVLAQDIYMKLTELGYRVFFSRITLESKLGVEYEPYIYSALVSSKIMLVLGMRQEYFNATWVKNEWSRFLGLMSNNRDKVLIPCYANMSAYDVPQALSILQGQDMNKVGAMQDLLYGIQKIIPLNKPESAPNPQPQPQPQPTQKFIEEQPRKITNREIKEMLEDARKYLLDEDWDETIYICDQVLSHNNENGLAYLYKLCADVKAKTPQLIPEKDSLFINNPNYQLALQFGDNKVKAVLKICKNKYTTINGNEISNYFATAYELLGEKKYDKVLNLVDQIEKFIGNDDDFYDWLIVCKIYRYWEVSLKNGVIVINSDDQNTPYYDKYKEIEAMLTNERCKPKNFKSKVIIDNFFDPNRKQMLLKVREFYKKTEIYTSKTFDLYCRYYRSISTKKADLEAKVIIDKYVKNFKKEYVKRLQINNSFGLFTNYLSPFTTKVQDCEFKESFDVLYQIKKDLYAVREICLDHDPNNTDLYNLTLEYACFFLKVLRSRTGNKYNPFRNDVKIQIGDYKGSLDRFKELVAKVDHEINGENAPLTNQAQVIIENIGKHFYTKEEFEKLSEEEKLKASNNNEDFIDIIGSIFFIDDNKLDKIRSDIEYHLDEAKENLETGCGCLIIIIIFMLFF